MCSAVRLWKNWVSRTRFFVVCKTCSWAVNSFASTVVPLLVKLIYKLLRNYSYYYELRGVKLYNPSETWGITTRSCLQQHSIINCGYSSGGLQEATTNKIEHEKFRDL